MRGPDAIRPPPTIVEFDERLVARCDSTPPELGSDELGDSRFGEALHERVVGVRKRHDDVRVGR